ncbi:MAG: A24 family peptidase [Gammaproteobacteria bacterium]|nr:A24 family peptidase [Gammaproteobacteria bacterium]
MELLAQFYQLHTTTALGLVALFSLMVGSFLNVVVHRLPIMLDREWRSQCLEFLDHPEPDTNRAVPDKYNLVFPRSSCPQCGHQIDAWQNIPVLSYLLQKGKCRHCDKPISPRYPVTEIMTMILSVIVIGQLGPNWHSVSFLFLTWSLIALSLIDFDHKLLPDDITLPVMWAGLALALTGIGPVDVKSSLAGAIIGYGSLWLIFQLFRLATGKEGMGYGDFKLFALLGAWLGWQQLPLIIILSSFVGAAVGIGNILIRNHHRSTPIPFGPFLCAAGFIAMLWGDTLIDQYLQLMRIRF